MAVPAQPPRAASSHRPSHRPPLQTGSAAEAPGVLRRKVHLERKADVVFMASLLPQRWASFIRNSPSEEVRPLGTRRLLSQQSAWGPGGRGAPTA